MFSHEEVEHKELQGYKITSGILSEFERVLSLTPAQFKQVLADAKSYPIEHRLIKLIPTNYVSNYLQTMTELPTTTEHYNLLELYARCRLVQDYISSMTDQIAYDTYRTLMVID